MASQFAKEFSKKMAVGTENGAPWEHAATQARARRIALALDLAMLKVSQALGHAQYRNHDHNPQACDGCAELEKVVESLKIW